MLRFWFLLYGVVGLTAKWLRVAVFAGRRGMRV